MKREPPPELLRAAFTGGDIGAIEDFCYELLADIEWRCVQEHFGEMQIAGRGLCYSAAQIDHYIFKLVSQCYAAQLPPPISLVELISAHLNQDIKYDKKSNEFGRGKAAALREAIEYKKLNPDASNREIAKAVGVDHTTIGRWKLGERLVSHPKCNG